MPHITWIIGNGFDVNLGLKTRYTDFFEVYIKNIQNDNTITKDFKKEIQKDEARGWKNWADFELGMGIQSKYFKGDRQSDDFLHCYGDFVNKFHAYLEKECLKIKWEDIDKKMTEEFRKSIFLFHTYLTKIQRNFVLSFKNNHANSVENSFLQLNYTNVFDELISLSEVKCSNNHHLHGALNMYPIMGVDNIDQIENEVIRNDIKVQKIFIKQSYLTLLQNRDVNTKIPAQKALSAISDSFIFCIFGASIGDTDSYWWQKIGEKMTVSNALLIIFDICGKIDNSIDPILVLEAEIINEERRNRIINQFLKLSGLGENWVLDNPDRIIVELDRPIFNFKLPQKENIG